MTVNSIDEKIIVQVSRCQDKFLSKANYYKERYIQLITVILSSLSVVVTVAFYSNRLSNSVAILKENVKSLKEYIGKNGTGKILYMDKDGECFFVSTKGVIWKTENANYVTVRDTLSKE